MLSFGWEQEKRRRSRRQPSTSTSTSTSMALLPSLRLQPQLHSSSSSKQLCCSPSSARCRSLRSWWGPAHPVPTKRKSGDWNLTTPIEPRSFQDYH